MIMRNFFYFFFFPSREVLEPKKFINKIVLIATLILCNFVFLLLATAIKTYLSTLYHLPSLKDAYSPAHGFLWIFILPVVVGPLREEILFRLWLLYSRFNLSFFLAILVFTASLMIYGDNLWSNLVHTGTSILMSACVFIGVFLILKKHDSALIRVWMRHTRLLTIISAILFGYFHLTNFIINAEIIFLSPLLLSPFIFAGLIFGYLRIRIGFYYSLITHSTINLIPALIYYFLR